MTVVTVWTVWTVVTVVSSDKNHANSTQKKSCNLYFSFFLFLNNKQSGSSYLPTYLPTYLTVVIVVTLVTVGTVVTVVSSDKNHATSPQKNDATSNVFLFCFL